MLLRRSPLFRRLLLSVALLALLPLLATAAGAALVARGAARAEAQELLRSDALFAREAALPLLRAHAAGGPEAGAAAAALDALAKRLGREAGVRLTFIAADGRVLGDSQRDPATLENHAERPEVRAAREGEVAARERWSESVQAELMYVAVRADPVDPAAGIVRAATSTAAIEAKFRRQYLAIALVAMPFGLAALFSAAVALGAFAHGVHDLSNAVSEVAAGGGPMRRTEAEDREDELGLLARAVRAMADELDGRIRTMARERNELATIVAGLGEGLIAIDGRARILLFNEAARAILGLGAPPPPGTPLVDALRQGDLIALARAALEEGHPLERRIDVFVGGSAGAARAVEVRATPFAEEVRGPGPASAAGIVILLRDVTEQERYEALRRDFVANVSHELRTPLALIKGFLETLEDGALRDPERGPRFLEILRRHVDGLDRLVADLLTLGALEAGAAAGPAEPVDAGAAIEAVLAPFEDAFAKRRLHVAWRVAPELPPISAVREQVERAIRNLVDNAVKFTPEGGAIEIEARAAGKAVEIAVRDSGPGIPRAEQARIFERFYRMEKSRSREAGGTGLGLAIVKHIAQQAGGSVRVESEPGKGATFTLSFPAAGPAA